MRSILCHRLWHFSIDLLTPRDGILRRTPQGRSELFGYDDEPQMFGSAPEPHVEREQTTAEYLCERDVLGGQFAAPWRDCASQATTFGIGSPHAVLSQPQFAGALAISGGSSAFAVGPAPLRPWSFATSLRRRSLSFIPLILAPGGRARDGLGMCRIEFIEARLRTSRDERRDRAVAQPPKPRVSGAHGTKPGAKTLTPLAPTPSVLQGPTAAAITFTRNSNLGSRHARAGKQARVGNHPARLRSCIEATLVLPHSIEARWFARPPRCCIPYNVAPHGLSGGCRGVTMRAGEF